MKNMLLVYFLIFIITSCSGPTKFLVKSVPSSNSIELEDGTIIKLIEIETTTTKYLEALKGLQDNYVTLYDENYDPINEIYEGNIFAYVYDYDQNCINDFSKGDDNSEISILEPTLDGSSISKEPNERISGRIVELMPNSSLSQMYEQNKHAVFLIAVPITQKTYAQGTGFFISSIGIGVSNFHVFNEGDYNQAIIKTIDNHQYRLKRILLSDEQLDFIVFEVENDHNDFPYLIIANELTSIGEDAFAIGNPQGLEHTLSKGIVSSYRENNRMIQTTTEITHGSSGGPLFNMRGEVIGITTSGIGEANLNFAMNIRELGIEDLIE